MGAQHSSTHYSWKRRPHLVDGYLVCGCLKSCSCQIKASTRCFWCIWCCRTPLESEMASKLRPVTNLFNIICEYFYFPNSLNVSYRSRWKLLVLKKHPQRCLLAIMFFPSILRSVCIPLVMEGSPKEWRWAWRRSQGQEIQPCLDPSPNGQIQNACLLFQETGLKGASKPRPCHADAFWQLCWWSPIECHIIKKRCICRYSETLSLLIHSFIANCLKDRAPLVVNPPDLNSVLSGISLNNIDFKENVNILQEQEAMTLSWILYRYMYIYPDINFICILFHWFQHACKGDQKPVKMRKVKEKAKAKKSRRNVRRLTTMDRVAVGSMGKEKGRRGLRKRQELPVLNLRNPPKVRGKVRRGKVRGKKNPKRLPQRRKRKPSLRLRSLLL